MNKIEIEIEIIIKIKIPSVNYIVQMKREEISMAVTA